AWLGLLGTEPDLEIAAARSAFEAGDMDAAIAAAVEAEAAWRAAPDVARGRMVSVALLIAAAGLGILLLAQVRHRRPGGWSSGRTP
ncbi:MAG: hypothetical protein HW391_1409, partial [Chloroflexi bacterium]|nr:hypothetical protein [Chloroflexota bacterium]